ncbi:MAG: type I DNA topoisomerase [Maricaulaceae bacterium]
MPVVVVESPAKAKTINKYLGKDYKVLASYGHVRDLPAKDGSVDPDNDFAMSWDVDSKAQKRLKDITDAVRESDSLILATDPDREGEAISWHVLEVLTKRRALKDKPVRRVAFNAVTKKAVLDAIANPRDLDMELVEAYLARRALDYLVGFTLSPVLWRKLPGSRSAGRVQSVALRLIVERVLEIEAFKAQEYWTVVAQAHCEGASPFPARLYALDGQRLQKFDLGDETAALKAKAVVEASDFTVDAVEAKPTQRKPPPPFTTSTLQQEASRKLGFAAKRTMQVAQKLYEGIDVGGETVGLITYIRTDGVAMAGEAIAQAREVIGERFGRPYLPDAPRAYSSKARNAQEAHEAIRPTSFARAPETLNLDADQAKLYGLIWKRAMASQMENARLERTTITLKDAQDRAELRATGSVITFDGFLTLYQEGQDDTEEDAESRLPAVKAGQTATARDVKADQHFTEPPPRFSEASLVKRLEELGIGRPSTYASILSVLQDRGYVVLEKKRFIPEDKGRLVTAFLENFFRRYVEYDFTADLENRLDQVSAGELSWKTLLAEFWREFSAAVAETGELRVADVLDALNESLGPHVFPEREDGGDPRQCPSCETGRLSLKVGKFGAFVGCSNYPECRFTRKLGETDAEAPAEDGELGTDPDTGEVIWLKSGRFGPYVERGEGDALKRASLPKGWTPDAMTLDQARRLLSLPRDVGAHPEDGEMITAAIGRYGPYVKHLKTYANLDSVEEVFEVGLNRAVSLIAEKKDKGGRRPGAEPLRTLGDHPATGEPVAVMKGRYGPYVKHQKINATLPKGVEVDTVTLEDALVLIAEKAGKTAKPKAKAKTAKAKTDSEAKPAAKSKAKTTTAKTKAKPKTAAKSATGSKRASKTADTPSAE